MAKTKTIINNHLDARPSEQCRCRSKRWRLSGKEMVAVDLTPPRDATLVGPSSAAMARFQRLHEAAGDLAEKAPEIIANPEAARGLEQALIEAMVACFGHREDRGSSVAQGQHMIVMRRFRRVVEENPDNALYIPEVCKAIGVSERTLRMCCEEHLGMSPKRYLLLPRMGRARRALREAAPDATSVTEHATAFGSSGALLLDIRSCSASPLPRHFVEPQ